MMDGRQGAPTDEARDDDAASSSDNPGDAASDAASAEPGLVESDDPRSAPSTPDSLLGRGGGGETANASARARTRCASKSGSRLRRAATARRVAGSSPSKLRRGDVGGEVVLFRPGRSKSRRAMRQPSLARRGAAATIHEFGSAARSGSTNDRLIQCGTSYAVARGPDRPRNMKMGAVWRGGTASDSMSMPMPLSIIRCFVICASRASTEKTPAPADTSTIELPVRSVSRSM
mmetsp:Transcript_25005/g.78008  ORF Transcript_25005/g.78008 Transcript_25005/m.78008 type:complete len:232 (+) Transcript_25005:370-1065(+)